MGRHSTCHPACRFPKNTHISTTHCRVSVVKRRALSASQGEESNDTPSLGLPDEDAPPCKYDPFESLRFGVFVVRAWM
jgi:hypothetical protein